MEEREREGIIRPPCTSMNRRKARFSRPVKVTQARVEVPSDEEDHCGREERPPPPPLGKFRINPADAPITPPLTPPRHGTSSGKATPTSAPATKAPPPPHHVLTTPLPALPPPPPSAPPPMPPSAPADEREHTVRLLLAVPPPPPPPPSVPPPPPPPPPAPSRQLNRLPPAPLTLYGPPTLDHTTRTHPLSLEDRQQQRTTTSDSPLAANAQPTYRPPAVNSAGRVPSPRGRNSRKQSPPREEQSGVPSILPYNLQVDFSVPPPPISQTTNFPPHILSLLGRAAYEHITENLRKNSSTSNVSRPHVPRSQEQSQILPVTFQVSQLNTVPQLHLTPSSVSQPHMPAHNFPSPRDQANSSHTLMHPHHLTKPNVRIHELPSHMPQHMSTYHSSHSHMPLYNRYPSVIPLPYGPLTDVPPTHGKSPHIAQQGQSYSRNISENSAAHHRPLNTEAQLYMAGSYKNSSSEPSFTNREGARRTSRDTPRDEYNSWYRRDDHQHTNITNNMPNMLNPWVPPPFQTPHLRPPPLPPPQPPPPQQQQEAANQIPLAHLLAMPTPPPDQHDRTLSPGSGNLYSNHSHSYQNYQGHQQYWNQQKTSSSFAVPEYHQPHHTDTRRSYDTTVSRWSQDVPHRLARYHAPTPQQPRRDNSAVQMDDDYRSSYHGHGAYIRGHGNRRGRTTKFPRQTVRQLVQVATNNENEDLMDHRQNIINADDEAYEKGYEACALFSAINAVGIAAGGAIAATAGTTAPAGVSPTGMPALPAPPVLPALPAPHTLPALMAAPWPSTAAASAGQDNEDDSVEKRLCLHSRRKDESAIIASSQLAVPFTNPAIQNDDPTAAMTSQYNEFIKMYMEGSFGDVLHVHQGQPSLSVTPKDPQTCLLPSTGQSLDVATMEINSGLLPSRGNFLLPDLFPSYLSLQTTIEDHTFLKNFWMSGYQQHGLKLDSLLMLQPQNADQLGIHLDQQMGENKYSSALFELNHRMLTRGSLGSATSLAVLPPALPIHSSKAEGSALTQYTQSGTLGTSPSHQTNFLRSALQDSSAQTPALPACSSSACCNNTTKQTTKQEQQQKELEQLKLFQTQQLQRKSEIETLRQRNEETLRQINEDPLRQVNEVTVRHMNEQLQLQQQRKYKEDKMKQMNEGLQKQSIQVHIEQLPQHTQQKKRQKKTEKVYALTDAHHVAFLQQQINEDGMIRENQHLETNPHQDANLQLNLIKAKKGRKRKSDQLEQESTMKWAMNREGHRESQYSSTDGMQKSVIVHGKGHVNQMPEFTYQQQIQSVNTGIMKDSQRQLSKQGKQEQQQKMPQLTQLLMQGQSEVEIYQMAKAQKQKVAPRAPELAAEQVIMEHRQRKQSEMPYNTQNKKALHVPNLFTDVHVQQKISEYIKQEPISSPTDGTVIKPNREQEHQLNMWPGNTLNMAKVAKDLQQAQLGVDIQRKPLSFSHHDAAAATQLTDGSQGLDLSCQRHVQKLVRDDITIKTEEATEEICDQTTNQQTQETFDLLEELDEIKLDTMQQQNTDQQQNLLDLPSFGSYLNVDGMEEVDVEEADLNAAYHAVVSLQQSEIPDVPGTPPSHTARSSENCQPQMNRSIVSNLSRTTKQLDEVSRSPKVVKKVPVIQMPQINPSPISVQIKTDADIRGAKVQQKPSRRSKKSFEKEEVTVPISDFTHKSKSDSACELIRALNETSHGHTVSVYKSAYKHKNTSSETITDTANDTVSGAANTRNTALTVATTRNSRVAVRKATHGSTPSTNFTESDKVASSYEAQAILQGVSSNSTYATAFETNDIASPSLQLSRTRKGVKRKYSTRQSKK